MAFRAAISSKIPLVIIVGATGTGKTKLSLELAQKFGTEIINADAMQIYKGLDIVTAKASRQEQQMVRHHLIDILEPNQVFTVVDFRNRVLKIIENLTQQKKIPFIVGGTNYYIESIVYKILVEDMDDDKALLWDKSRRKRDLDEFDKDDIVPCKVPRIKETHILEEDDEPTTSQKSAERDTGKDDGESKICRIQLQQDIDNERMFTDEEMHAKLKAIDPNMAAMLHPNNRRKVMRSLEVWLKNGRRHSEILSEQKCSEGELRRPDSTIILFLTCEKTVLQKRLDDRVDSMVEKGLVDELLTFHETHNKRRIKEGKPLDYTKGMFQILGFKEFHPYLMLSESDRTHEIGQNLLKQCIEIMKIRTRQYARTQNKMIRGRFLEHPSRQMPLIYELDTTDVAKWDDEVKNKAINIIESFLNDSPSIHQPLKPKLDRDTSINRNSYNYCDVCQRIMIGDTVYAIHLKSNRHKAVAKRKKLHHQTNKIEKKQLEEQPIKQE